MRRRSVLVGLAALGTGCLNLESNAADAESATSEPLTTSPTAEATSSSPTPTETSSPTATGTPSFDPASVDPTVRWRAEGFRTITLDGGALVGATGSGLQRLDVETGEPVWSVSGGEDWRWRRIRIADGTVFALARRPDGGREVVKRPLDTGERVATYSYEFRSSGMPMLTENLLLLVSFDGDADRTELIALDRETLDRRWTQTAPETKASPDGAVEFDGTVHVGFSNSLRGFAAADGSLEYRSPLGVHYPVAFDGDVIADASSSFARIDLPSLELEWTVDRDVVGRPLLADSTVYARTWNGLVAVDAASGKERWYDLIEESSSAAPRMRPGYHRGVVWTRGPDANVYGYAAASGERAFSIDAHEARSVLEVAGSLVVETETREIVCYDLEGR